jgi:hypothetical protein
MLDAQCAMRNAQWGGIPKALASWRRDAHAVFSLGRYALRLEHCALQLQHCALRIAHWALSIGHRQPHT